MASHATHIRRIYGRPWRNGSLANPGKIPTCIQVSVRPESTGTLETMLEPCPQLPTGRTGLAAVGRIDIHDGDPNGTGLVLDEALQLPERPAVEPCAHAPAGPKAIADVREILHHDRGRANASGFLENRLARFVVDAKHQFRFLRQAARQDLSLVIPEDHRHPHTPLQGVERDRFALERIGAVVEMDAGAVKRQGWDRRVLGGVSQSRLRAIRLTHREDGVARHLCAQRSLLSQCSVTELMQGDPIPTARSLHQWYEPIAGIGVGGAQCTQSDGLLRRHVQSNAGGAHHALSPVRDLLGTLDIALDGRGDERACGANCLVEAVPVSQQIDHASYRCLYIHTGQVLDAIPPLTEVRGFLAEMS